MASSRNGRFVLSLLVGAVLLGVTPSPARSQLPVPPPTPGADSVIVVQPAFGPADTAVVPRAVVPPTDSVVVPRTVPPLPPAKRQPGPSGAGNYDWVELVSGEWLKGKIKGMRDDDLTFDSEELDVQKLTFSGIRALRSGRLQSVWLESGETHDGGIDIDLTQIKIFGPDTTFIFPRRLIVAITPTGKSFFSPWTLSIAAGLSLRGGNTQEVDFNSHSTLKRQTPGTRLILDHLANYGKTNGTETEDNQRASASFDYYFSRSLFMRLPDLEYYKDPLQNIAARFTVGVGAGWQIVKKKKVEWDFTLGPAYQFEEFESVAEGVDKRQDSTAIVIGSYLELDPTGQLEFTFTYRGQITSLDSGDNTQHGEATMEYELHKLLNFDTSFIWDRVANPMTGASGDTPDADDLRLIVALGIDL